MSGGLILTTPTSRPAASDRLGSSEEHCVPTIGDQRWGDVLVLYKHANAKDYTLILDNVAKGFVALLVPVETRLGEYQSRNPDLIVCKPARASVRTRTASIAGMSMM